MARGMQRNLREPYMRRKSRATSANPFLAWSDLSWKFGEMWMASAQVVAHRTARMAAAGPMPGSRDRREFALMGQEKVEAAAESALAIGAHLAAMNLEFGARAMRNAMTDGAAWMSLATSRSVSELMSRQLHVAQSDALLQRELAALHLDQQVGEHRQGLPTLNDIDDLRQWLQEHFALQAETHSRTLPSTKTKVVNKSKA